MKAEDIKEEYIHEHTRRRDKAMNSGRYDYFNMLRQSHGGVVIKGYDTYPRNSVLAGQTRINFIDSFEDFEEALMMKLWGEHADWSNKYLEPQNTFNHLPDDGDGW